MASPPPRSSAGPASERLLKIAPPLGGELRDYLARHRADLARRLAAGEDGLSLGRRHAKVLDGLMSSLHAAACAAVAVKGTRPELAAVGSYGRGAVALRSDADVRLIVPAGAKHRESAKAFAEALLYPLWDVGLSVGHQVIDPGEALGLAQTDLATATSLLDLRHLAGDKALTTQLCDRAWSGLFSEGQLADFVERLEAEAAARHERFGASVYLLEPDVKSGAGGLRDLDGARWAARARFKVGGDPAGDPWTELVRLGVLVAREAKEIGAAEQFLWRVRNRLHAHAGRRSDRLTFDEQETVAVEMGYQPKPEDGDHAEDAARAAAAERFMQDYYLHARVVTRSRETILYRAKPPRRRGRAIESDLGDGLRLFDGQVTIAGTAELSQDPALALRAYAACVRQGAPILPFAREAIARAASDPAWCEELRKSREAAQTFVELVCTVPEVRTRRGSIAGELHDVGLLLAMIPEFAPVTGRVHHDVYHVYTVDVHSVAAVDCLRQLCRGELAHERPLASRLAAEIARPVPLFLATLLHDVGKGYPDASGSRKNHSRSGAELCDVILPRLDLSPGDVAEARALVASHLTMYHTATRRDTGDPAAVEEFVRNVRGREGLRELYLLTVADITTTSPTAMTSWKARMLDELYFAADAFLAGRKDLADVERFDRARKDALRLWSGPREHLEEFLATMPERYLVANAADAIVAHARVALERKGAAVHAALVPSRHPDVAELCVVARDRPGLLKRIAAAITAGRLEVLAAQVYSRTKKSGEGEAVDLFWVRDRVDGAEGAHRNFARLLKDLRDFCESEQDPQTLLAARLGSGSPWRERPSPAVLTEVSIDDRASPRHTVIEVFAKDRPGLLFTLARALHEMGLSIALSKINTEGTKVADVFYVNDLDGKRVAPERFKEIRDALVKAIG
jgi:[protein-PII] uridylyltransferase